MKANLVQLQKEMEVIKHRIVGIEKELHQKTVEPIIIEAINDSDLTPRQRKHAAEALADFKAGRTDRFVTLEEFKASLQKRKKSTS